MPTAEVRCAAIVWRENKARKRASKGQIVELPDDAFERLLALGDIQVPGSAPVFTAPEATPLARPFREGENSVTFETPEALKPPAREPESTPPETPVEADLTTAEGIAAYITQAEPNAEATVALAGGDPEVAKSVIEAERIAAGGDGRKTVISALEKLIANPPETPAGESTSANE